MGARLARYTFDRFSDALLFYCKLRVVQLSIPEHYIARYLREVREVLRAVVVTLEDLQSVNGNLKNFLC